MIQDDLDLMDALDPIIARLEKRMWAQAQHHDPQALALLETLPGIGDILALTIVYEIHRIDRFASEKKFASYSRVVTCEQSSNGKTVGRGNQKIGNPDLKWAVDQIIVRAQPNQPLIKLYYQSLKAKHGPRKAKAIIGHKFATSIYDMLKKRRTV